MSIISTLYYHQKYISKRDTLILRDVNLTKSINASILSDKLKNLKWITHHYPDNPSLEIENLLSAIEIIKADKRKKMFVTDYQFISVILSMNDNSASRIWWRHHIYPEPDEKYFINWKNFLISKIINKNIEVIYTIKPLEGENDIFEGLISKDCYSNEKKNKILVLQTLNDCNEFKKLTNLKK